MDIGRIPELMHLAADPAGGPDSMLDPAGGSDSMLCEIRHKCHCSCLQLPSMIQSNMLSICIMRFL
jgi:hypothetical protein